MHALFSGLHLDLYSWSETQLWPFWTEINNIVMCTSFVGKIRRVPKGISYENYEDFCVITQVDLLVKLLTNILIKYCCGGRVLL